METYHGSWEFNYVIRYFQMLVGAIFLATLCRDRLAFNWGIQGFLLGSLVLGLLVFTNSYESLSREKADDFKEASMIRGRTFEESSIQTDLNKISFFTAQGAAVALALALFHKALIKHYLFLGIAGFCALATLLPMSRGGLAILLLTGGAVVFYRGLLSVKVILTAALVGLVVLLWVPDSVFSRFTLSRAQESIESGGELKGRARVYNAIIKYLPEYFFTGVGINNFYGSWGRQTDFWSSDHMTVTAAHNCYAQITINWGVVALLAWLAMIWQSYRSLPGNFGQDPLRLCLLAIVISVFLETLVIHVFQGKEFTIALGLIVAGHIWIWPPRKSRVPRRQGRILIRHHQHYATAPLLPKAN